MSINVTVTGNPVSIKRGKMVTTNCDNPNKEFEKRRLMRLEQVSDSCVSLKQHLKCIFQVRQQSKDIAENVRNKVRKEKKKQLSAIEKEGEEKLKEWQARKLLELQNQYQECLKDIGLGHKQAELMESEEKDEADRRKTQDAAAKDRGRKAAQELQIERNEKNMKVATSTQRKKITRDVENTRSMMVSQLNKKSSPFKKNMKKKKKVSANINISNVVSQSEESDVEVNIHSTRKNVSPTEDDSRQSSTQKTNASASESSETSVSLSATSQDTSDVMRVTKTKEKSTRERIIQGMFLCSSRTTACALLTFMKKLNIKKYQYKF